MDLRRLKLIGMIVPRLRYIWYLITKGKFAMAYNHLWVGLFTRDSGLAITDSIYRTFPFIRPYPKAIEIEMTTRCHLKCAICEHTYWKEPQRDMTFDEFKHIVDQFPDLKWIGTSGIGSNFLNKDFMKMLRYLKERNVYVEFFDSFDLIDEKVARELVEMQVDKIWMSLDASDPEDYAKIRVGTNLPKVLGHVNRLLEIKEELKSPLPEVWFQMIVTNINVARMPDYVDLIHSIIKDKKYNYANLIFWTNILSFGEVKKLATDIPDDIRAEVVRRAQKHNIRLNWNENIHPSNPPSCCVRWNEPFVLVSGHVQPCCIINQANQRDHQKQFAFGNLLEEDFHDIWKSKKFQGFCDTLQKDRFPAICKYCRLYLPKQDK